MVVVDLNFFNIFLVWNYSNLKPFLMPRSLFMLHPRILKTIEPDS